jgi:hypothetical protein
MQNRDCGSHATIVAWTLAFLYVFWLAEGNEPLPADE